ncbi:MAG: hypothetical protein R3281_15185, partial [Balneolaceae bacterium]|nr:hypothetical protein [Balneolaceae bacterium]
VLQHLAVPIRPMESRAFRVVETRQRSKKKWCLREAPPTEFHFFSAAGAEPNDLLSSAGDFLGTFLVVQKGTSPFRGKW